MRILRGIAERPDPGLGAALQPGRARRADRHRSGAGAECRGPARRKARRPDRAGRRSACRAASSAAPTCAPGRRSATTCCAPWAHNAPLRVLDSVEGDDGDEWYRVNWLDSKTQTPVALGYIHNSLVRLPRLPYTPLDARPGATTPGRHFEADLQGTGAADRLRRRRADLVDADAQGHDHAIARRPASTASCGACRTRR